MSQKIERKNWDWCGFPKHFIAAEDCEFRMSTKVGDWAVSTVGAYRPPHGDGEIEEIGAGRYYETMVFSAKEAGCDCCNWKADVNQERGDYPGGCYTTAQEACEGHIEICKYISQNQEVNDDNRNA